MILSIDSSVPTFKSVSFHEGLNIFVADTSPNATEGQTRNSAGKTSLLEIIHFLLGADCGPDSLFRTTALIDHTFTGTFEFGGSHIKVQRSGSAPAKIFVLAGGEGRTDLLVKKDKESGHLCVSNTHWKMFLGHAMFGMPAEVNGTEYDASFTPSFRSMFAYFARRKNSGAFLHPERNADQQRRWDWQVNLSYLLGLDWRIPFSFNKVREQERMLEELKKAAKGGALGAVVGTVAELRPQVAVADAKAKRMREQLSRFEVLDSYRDLTRRAARTKTEMQAVGRDLIGQQETLTHLEAALADEAPPNPTDLQQVYTAAGIELPGVVLRRFAEVRKFYDSVVSNRRAHLEQEIAETKRRIRVKDDQLVSLNTERSDILRTLEGQGALEDFLSLQRNLAELDAAAASLSERFKAAELLEGEATQLDIDRVNLKQRLQADHQARRAVLEEAILVIAEAITTLYDDRSGGFVVEATDNGPEFRITIEGDRGGGISNIEIYCLDLALLKLVSKRLGGPGFLIHDSHLFDGVDERQIAGALLLGQQATLGHGLQYIVTMNSDIYDRLPLSSDIDSSAVVLSTRLSDDTDTGGLFGFRFE